MKSLIFFIALSIFFTVGCQQETATEPETVQPQSGRLQKTIYDNIVAANQNFMDAFAAQDAEAMGGLYTQEAQLLPPNGAIQEGNAAVEAFWGSLFDAGFDGVILETLEVFGTGSTASEVGLFTLFLNGSVFDSGKYIVIWEKVKGKWYLHRDIWNSSNPAP